MHIPSYLFLVNLKAIPIDWISALGGQTGPGSEGSYGDGVQTRAHAAESRSV
jgi:hypothetical protein